MVIFFFLKCMENKEKGLFHCIMILFFFCSCVKPKLDLRVALKASHSLRMWDFDILNIIHIEYFFSFSLLYQNYPICDSTWQMSCTRKTRGSWSSHPELFSQLQGEQSLQRRYKKNNKKKPRGAGDCWQIKNRKKMQMWRLALVNKPQIIFQVGAMCKECLIVLPHPTSLCCFI